MRSLRSSSWELTFSMTAITMREAKILFSTTSVPTSCRPITSELAAFFLLGGFRQSRQTFIVPSSHTGRHVL